MDTKEAIDFVKKHNKKEFFYTWERKSFKDIISLLSQGEKYKQMWEELYTEYGMCPIRKNDEEGYMSNILYKFLEDLQQKYFPKEAKQDYPESEE